MNSSTKIISGKNITRDILFSYWDELPLTKFVDKEAFNLQPIEDAILRTLRWGILENGKKRHVLSLKELLPEVNKYLENYSPQDFKPLKMTTLYYHRDILIQKELIIEVAAFLKGKRYVSYYGRTAKGFILKGMNPESIKKYTDSVREVVKLVNPNVDMEQLNELLDVISRLTLENRNFLLSWIEKHESLIVREDIDVIDLYDLFGNFLMLYPGLLDANMKLGKILKLPGFS